MNRICSLALCLSALTLLAAEKPRTDLYGDPLPPGAVARMGTLRLRHAKADIAFTKDGKQLISFGRNGEVRVWDTATGALLRRKQLLKDHLREVALSPDGTRAAAWSRTEILLYDTASGEKRSRLESGFPTDYGYDPRKLLAFSSNGKVLGACGEIWDITTNKTEIIHVKGDLTVRWMLSVAPDGKRAAGIIKWMPELEEPGGQVHLWDVAANREIGGKEGIATRGLSVAFSADSKLLAIGGGGGFVRLVDAADGKKKRSLPQGEGGSVTRLAFSPDGRLVVAMIRPSKEDGPDFEGVEVRSLIEAASGQEIVRLKLKAPNKSLFHNLPSPLYSGERGWG